MKRPKARKPRPKTKSRTKGKLSTEKPPKGRKSNGSAGDPIPRSGKDRHRTMHTRPHR